MKLELTQVPNRALMALKGYDEYYERVSTLGDELNVCHHNPHNGIVLTCRF